MCQIQAERVHSVFGRRLVNLIFRFGNLPYMVALGHLYYLIVLQKLKVVPYNFIF